MFDPEQFVNAETAQLFRIANAYFLGRYTDVFDVLHVADMVAAKESADYYSSHMLAAQNFPDSHAILSHALGLRREGGLILEFGVASGNTINHIAGQVPGEVHGFDVFSGLPEDWRTGFPKGAFAQPLPEVRPNVKLHVGLFGDTLGPFVAQHQGSFVSLLHVDCDLYSSTVTIFEHLQAMIVPGTVIVFDEYWNYPGWKQHEFKAFAEFCERAKVTYRYDSFVSNHQQVCAVIETVG